MCTKVGKGTSLRDRETGFLSCGLCWFQALALLHSQHISAAPLRATFPKGEGQLQRLPGGCQGGGEVRDKSLRTQVLGSTIQHMQPQPRRPWAAQSTHEMVTSPLLIPGLGFLPFFFFFVISMGLMGLGLTTPRSRVACSTH